MTGSELPSASLSIMSEMDDLLYKLSPLSPDFDHLLHIPLTLSSSIFTSPLFLLSPFLSLTNTIQLFNH
jgi:hypothetical protein